MMIKTKSKYKSFTEHYRFHLVQSAAICARNAAADHSISVRRVCEIIKAARGGHGFRYDDVRRLLAENNNFERGIRFDEGRDSGFASERRGIRFDEERDSGGISSRARFLSKKEEVRSISPPGRSHTPGQTHPHQETTMGTVIRGTKQKGDPSPTPITRPTPSPREQQIKNLVDWFSAQVWGATDRSKPARNCWGTLLDDHCKGDAEQVKVLVQEAYDVKHSLLNADYPRFHVQTVLFYARYKRPAQRDGSRLAPVAYKKLKEQLAQETIDGNLVHKYIRVFSVRWEQVRGAFTEPEYDRLFAAASDAQRGANS